MKPILFILLSLMILTYSCKENNQEKQYNNLNTNKNIIQKKGDKALEKEDLKYSNKGSLRFLDHFIYRYQNQEHDGEVVLYYDYINKLVLYHPEDDMTDFVIIDSNGSAYLFYTGEHGEKTMQMQQLTFTNDNPKISYPISKALAEVMPLEAPFQINQKSYYREDLIFQGYDLIMCSIMIV